MSDTRTIITDDGCVIACDYRPRGDAPTVVLSPSLGTAMALFDAQVEALADCYSILRYDPRGHGSSAIPEGGYSLDRLGRDVIGLLDVFDIDRAHFVGVSLGGMTGQWMGYRAPERLLSLTLANTSAYMGPPTGWADRIRTVLDMGMDAMVEPVIERWFTTTFRSTCETEVARIAAMLAATAPKGYAGCCAAIRDMDLRGTASLIDVPTLVIAGAQDPATPPEHANYLASAIDGAKLVTLDAAHLSNVEQTTLFNNALLRFLESP